jgi:hypothetical protein
MNADNFSKYLQDRSLLHQVPYEELKTLAMQYPYCQPLQLLMLRKSLQDKRKDWEFALSRVAATTSDRSLLYAEVAENIESDQEEEVFQLSQDFLELSSFDAEAEELELASLDRDTTVTEPSLELDFSGVSSASGEADYRPENDIPTSGGAGEKSDFSSPGEKKSPEEEIDTWKNQELEALEAALNVVTSAPSMDTTVKKETRPEDLSRTGKLEQVVATAVSIAGILEPVDTEEQPAEEFNHDRMAPHEPLHALKPSPRPKSSFTSWVAQFQPPDIQTQLSDIMESKKMEDRRVLRKNKKKESNSNVDEIVLQSITENGNLVSETLANVLAKQGQSEKAEEMYRRLMLVFPEKSDYFAQQISNIKRD